MDWGRIIETVATTTVPIVLYMWANRRKAIKENAAKHQQNLSLLEEIVNERQFFPPHEHLEREGPLTVQGIRVRKRNGKI